MNKKKKVTLYIIFALIATVANLLTQRVILSFNTTSLYFIIALLLGTFVGLLIKFFLDKNWIFSDNTRGIKSQGGKFGIYTIMGIFSTIIFWGTETIFWLIWQKDNLREFGGLIGLSIGYSIKYGLDKRFVFEKK